MMSEKNNGISRRSVLKGAAVGGLGIAAGGSLLAGCGSKDVGPMKWGGRGLEESSVQWHEAVKTAYETATGNTVTLNMNDANAFQNNLSQYLQGTPDDGFDWMAGYRMQFYADQGLLEDVSSVWDEIGDQFAESYKIASTGSDGKQYFLPTSWYPWGLHYRKSTMTELGLDPENIATWDDFMKMLEATKKKGLIGYALGDKGGWEAMGSFDILNARINGYQFHVDLLAGKEKWTDAKVAEVFKYFEMMIPYMNKNVLDISWEGMRDLLLQKKCGAMMMGSWFSGDFKTLSQADYDDLWIVPFPEINPEHGRDTIDAPIDGLCVAANGENTEGGKELVKWLASKDGMQARLDSGNTFTSANSGQDTSSYDPFQKQQLAVMGEAKYITQFLDRDTRQDFANPVVAPAIQNFLRAPKDINKILESVQKQWDALPAL
jgi:multiple sugar transport system substrate-binding protein